MTVMTNRELFKKTFGIYATELWAMEEEEFLNWCNDLVTKTEDVPVLYNPYCIQISCEKCEHRRKSWECPMGSMLSPGQDEFFCSRFEPKKN